MRDSDPHSCPLFSIGHSNQPLEKFLDLLKQHEVDVLVDVRSQPYCAYSTHFNAEPLKSSVTEAGVKYLFLGRELGGRPEGDWFYDEGGHVLYGKVAESPLFLQGIERLEKGISLFRVAMMCSEENPAICHRHLLVARVLEARGTTVVHIRGDGRTKSDAEMIAENRPAESHQLSLFGDSKPWEWKSLSSVSFRKQRRGTE